MHQAVSSAVEKRRKQRRRRRVWTRIVSIMACLVVFCTTYALILPAITLEKVCELEEHVHEDACYFQVTSNTVETMECVYDLHTHRTECYGGNGELQCGYADYVIHQHDEFCVDANHQLICELPEVSLHVHDESCYQMSEVTTEEVVMQQVQQVHEHGEACYEKVQGELLCGLEENEEHAHEDACYTWSDALICEAEYDLIEVEVTQPVVQTESVLICSRPEVILHTHSEACGYLESGAYACGLLQVEEHAHTNACVHVEEFPIDTETLTCGLEESEEHQHTPLCHGQWINLCEKEEHVHVKDCNIKAEVVLAEQELEALLYTDDTYEALIENAGTRIAVTGMLPMGGVVKAYPVEVESEQEVLCAYDITIFTEEGDVYEAENENNYSVTIEEAGLSEGNVNERIVKIYYVEDSESQTLMPSELEDGKVTFSTNHFSLYMAVAEAPHVVSSSTEFKSAMSNKWTSIQLGANIKLSEPFTIDSAVILDLNGYTIEYSGSQALFQVNNNGSVMILDGKNGAAGNGNSSRVTIEYEVMTSQVVNAETGQTQESTQSYSVTSAAAVYAKSSAPLIQIAEGGTFALQGGVLYGSEGSGRAIQMNGGEAYLTGGYICNFIRSSDDMDSNRAFGGAIRAEGGTININGSVLAKNAAPNGGAIYAANATINMSSGVISGNVANRTTNDDWAPHSENATYRCGGGGIYAAGDSQIHMTGGYITYNTVEDRGYFDGGGGVCLTATADMFMSNGYVTGNIASGGSGIRTDFRKQATFTLTGGFICGNTATDAEGGGVSIDNTGTGHFYGGYITNNTLLSTEHWGGGGLFCADGSSLYLRQALITNNSADGLGGGIAGCPTGKIYLFIDDGCAAYNNSAEASAWVGGGSKHDVDKQVADELFLSQGYEDYFCARNSTVTGTMLGGKAANWKGSADGTPVEIEALEAQSATIVMGLTSYPTAEGIAAAEMAARVYLNGNHSETHGGGIMCNGNLIVGKPANIETPAVLQFRPTKSYLDGEGNEKGALAQYNFQFELRDANGELLETAQAQDNGTIHFNTLLNLNSTGEYVYYLREVYPSQPVQGAEYDNTIYRVTVTIGARTTELSAGGDVYGRVTAHVITQALIETSQDQGKTWTERGVFGYEDSSNVGRDNLVLNPAPSGTTFVNKDSKVTQVSVEKKWAEGVGAESVTVHLKKDGTIVETVVLNASNNWSHVWNDLESGFAYTVEEAPMIGFAPSYEIIYEQDYTGAQIPVEGSWWVPATEMVVGGKYMIVNQDGNVALSVTEAHKDAGFTAADTLQVDPGSGMLTVGDQSYTSWFANTDIPASAVFTVATRTVGGHSGCMILKNNSSAFDSWLLAQNSGGNYLKGTTAKDWSSVMYLDGGYIRSHKENNYTPDQIRTLIFGDRKFNTVSSATPANAARLYKLVSGTGTQVLLEDTSKVVITNVPVDIPTYELPETGGTGTTSYTMAGSLLMLCSTAFLLYRYIKRRREAN